MVKVLSVVKETDAELGHIETRAPNTITGMKDLHDIYLEIKCSTYTLNKIKSLTKKSIPSLDISVLDSIDNQKAELGTSPNYLIMRLIIDILRYT